MEWSFEEGGSSGRVNVKLRGDCDLYDAPRFKAEMLKKIESGEDGLLFDMSGIAYLDSTGVGAIIAILQAAKRRGLDLRFAGISGSPRRVLEMSSILPLLRMETVAAEAPRIAAVR